jgi:hypothetical protein
MQVQLGSGDVLGERRAPRSAAERQRRRARSRRRASQDAGSGSAARRAGAHPQGGARLCFSPHGHLLVQRCPPPALRAPPCPLTVTASGSLLLLHTHGAECRARWLASSCPPCCAAQVEDEEAAIEEQRKAVVEELDLLHNKKMRHAQELAKLHQKIKKLEHHIERCALGCGVLCRAVLHRQLSDWICVGRVMLAAH